MGRTTLTKMDKLTIVGEVLQDLAAGLTLTVSEARRYIGKTLDLVSRQSYYNQVEWLEDVMGVVEMEEGVGLRVLPLVED